MTACTVLSRGSLRSALLAAAISLSMAFGSASAKSPKAEDHGSEAAGSANLAVLLEDISAASQVDRRAAEEAFVAACTAAEMDNVISVVLPALQDVREEQRYYALVGLGAAGLASTGNAERLGDIAQALVNGLYDDRASVREAAAAAIAAIQPTPPDWAGGPLTDLLDDPEPRVVSAAMRALERLPANYAGLDAVQVMMDGDNAANRSRAVRVLGSPGGNPSDADAQWTLVWALHDPDAGVRWQAATALGALGDAGGFALHDLYVMSRDRSETPENRRAAAIAFITILD